MLIPIAIGKMLNVFLRSFKVMAFKLGAQVRF
jgi:hypothetical protein